MFADLEWYLGALLVLVYAHGRFNMPKSNRVSTTAARFYFAASSYCGAAFVLYILLAGMLVDSPEIVRSLSAGNSEASGTLAETDILKDLEAVSAPLLAALILTVLLPNFPAISHVDGWLLRFFQDLGNIPLEVRVLSAQLRRRGALVPDSMHSELQEFVRTKLELSGIEASDLELKESESPQHEWTVLLSLVLQIQAWEGNRRFRGVLDSSADKYEMIKEKFSKVTTCASRYFRMLREAHDGVGSPNPFLAECRRNLRDQHDDLYREICELVARGVLKCGWTKTDRNEILSQMGFKGTDPVGGVLSPNQIVALVAMLFIAVLIGVNAIGSQVNPIHRTLLMSTMIATIYGASVVCAIIPKARWKMASIKHTGERPVVGYIMSGVLAVGVAALLSIVFKTLLFLDFTKAVLDLRTAYPYFGMAFMTAAVTAALCDDFAAGGDAAPRFLRWLEGAAEAVALVGTAYFVWLVLKAIPRENLPELPVFLGLSCVLGLLIGTTVPTWYRRSLGQYENSGLAAVPNRPAAGVGVARPAPSLGIGSPGAQVHSLRAKSPGPKRIGSAGGRRSSS